MAYLEGSLSKYIDQKSRGEIAQSCNYTAKATEMIESRSVVLMSALDPAVNEWRSLLQGMGLTVFNGFHQEGLGDRPVVLLSEALWRQSDWPRNYHFIRRQFPDGILCVVGNGIASCPRPTANFPHYWDDARAMLCVAGVDFFTVEEPCNASDAIPYV